MHPHRLVFTGSCAADVRIGQEFRSTECRKLTTRPGTHAACVPLMTRPIMTNHLRRLAEYATGIALATLAVACAEGGPTGPDRHPAGHTERGASTARAAELGGCGKLEAPLGSTVAFHAYARGMQIYRWSGT